MTRNVNTCDAEYGTGLGGLKRTCRLESGHKGRCTDLPCLIHFRSEKKKVAQKIERDSFNTRGASWGRDRDGKQARRNRQPRWTLVDGDSFYPRHHQTYENCLVIAEELALQAYEMVGAPACPDDVELYLPRLITKDSALCPICLLPMEFSEFDLAQQSKAAIDTDHLNPSLERRHAPGNVAFVHHECNTTKGDRSVEEFDGWMIDVLRRKGFSVKQT